MTQHDAAQEPPDDDHVPIFGSWRAIYTAVLVNAALVMLLIALFSRWSF